MSKPPAPDTQAQPQADTFYDPQAIFHEDGPLDPMFMADATQALMRAHPLDTPEPQASQRRHMNASLTAMAAMHPRDPIEVMLAVQAVSAYHAACACWRIGMNLRQPRGDSTRHLSAAASAARTFDALLRAIERRQAKPLSVPIGRPAPRVWSTDKASPTLDWLAQRVRLYDETPVPELPRRPAHLVAWTTEAVAIAQADAAAGLCRRRKRGPRSGECRRHPARRRHNNAGISHPAAAAIHRSAAGPDVQAGTRGQSAERNQDLSEDPAAANR